MDYVCVIVLLCAVIIFIVVYSSIKVHYWKVQAVKYKLISEGQTETGELFEDKKELRDKVKEVNALKEVLSCVCSVMSECLDKLPEEQKGKIKAIIGEHQNDDLTPKNALKFIDKLGHAESLVNDLEFALDNLEEVEERLDGSIIEMKEMYEETTKSLKNFEELFCGKRTANNKLKPNLKEIRDKNEIHKTD